MNFFLNFPQPKAIKIVHQNEVSMSDYDLKKSIDFTNFTKFDLFAEFLSIKESQH